MKSVRHDLILDIIDKKDIETQEELVKELQNSGFEVTQATVSRDIKELGLIKISADGKRQKYTKERTDNTVMSKFTDMFRHSVVTIDYALNIVVIKTLSGSANVAGTMVDRLKNSSVLGCVAGDDTVFAVLRDERAAEDLTQKLREIAFD